VANFGLKFGFGKKVRVQHGHDDVNGSRAATGMACSIGPTSLASIYPDLGNLILIRIVA
jgi:hypothetical protein